MSGVITVYIKELVDQYFIEFSSHNLCILYFTYLLTFHAVLILLLPSEKRQCLNKAREREIIAVFHSFSILLTGCLWCGAAEEDTRKFEDLEELVWDGNRSPPDQQIDQFLILARQVKFNSCLSVVLLSDSMDLYFIPEQLYQNRVFLQSVSLFNF